MENVVMTDKEISSLINLLSHALAVYRLHSPEQVINTPDKAAEFTKMVDKLETALDHPETVFV